MAGLGEALRGDWGKVRYCNSNNNNSKCDEQGQREARRDEAGL